MSATLTWPDYAVLAGSLGVLLLLIETKRLALGWSWLVIVGTAGTIALALLLSLPSRSRRPA